MAIGTAYIKIMPEAKGISGQISGMVDPAAEAAGTKGGGKWVSAFKKVLVGAAVGKWIGDSVLAGADLEQSIGGIETLYKSASGKMQKYASQAYKTAGIDANTYMQQATSFSAALIKSYNGDVSKAADATDQAIIDMADNANKMGTPLENIQNAYQGFAKQNYTMLDNLKLGYGGTKTEMERLLKDAQKITGVKYDINNLSDVYDAIHVIQTEIGITGTTQEEAAKTISGSIGMVKASYKDLIANLALGKDVYPQIKNLVSSVGTMLKNVVPAIGRVIIGIPKAIWENRGAIIASVNKLMASAWDAIIAASPTIIEKVREIFVKVVNYIAKKGPSILLKILEIGSNIVGYITTLLTSILAGLLLGVKDIGVKVLDAIKKRLDKIKANIVTKLAEIKTKITTGVATFASNLLKPFKEAKTNIASKFNEIKSSIGTKIGEIKTKITNGVATIKDKLTKPFTSARDKIKSIIDKIKGFFPLSMGKLFGDIKLPHFEVHGKFPYGIGGGEKPSFSIEWYKKAETEPYMFQDATLFGAGERNDEILYGRKQLMKDIAEATNGGDEITINVYGGNMNAEEIADAVERKLIQRQKRRTLAWQ